jgi:hypothetical protein
LIVIDYGIKKANENIFTMNRAKYFFKGKVGFGADKFHGYIFSLTGIIYSKLWG